MLSESFLSVYFFTWQMKSSIVQQLSAVHVETVLRLQQVSNVVALATSVVSEVTVEAQVTNLMTRERSNDNVALVNW